MTLLETLLEARSARADDIQADIDRTMRVQLWRLDQLRSLPDQIRGLKECKSARNLGRNLNKQPVLVQSGKKRAFSKNIAKKRSEKDIEQMLGALSQELYCESNIKRISFTRFLEFMFHNRFSRGVEDADFLGLLFSLLLTRKEAKPLYSPKATGLARLDEEPSIKSDEEDLPTPRR